MFGEDLAVAPVSFFLSLYLSVSLSVSLLKWLIFINCDQITQIIIGQLTYACLYN